MKRGRSDEQNQPRFKKRDPNQDRSSYPKVMYERGGGSQSVKPTCSTCGKKNFEKCLVGTNESFGYGKNDHKVRYCPTIEARGR